MKREEFRALPITKRYYYLYGKLAKESKGLLLRREIAYILKSLDLDKQYDVIVTQNPSEFAEFLTIKHYRYSWLDKRKILIQKAGVIQGNITLGHEEYIEPSGYEPIYSYMQPRFYDHGKGVIFINQELRTRTRDITKKSGRNTRNFLIVYVPKMLK